jgi:hypothetical protein
MADGTLKVGTITTSSGSGTITIGQSGETLNVGTGVVSRLGKFESQLLHVRDEKASGTEGGATSSGDNTCVLNTIKTNEITGASLSSNQITLPSGTYYIDASVPGFFVDRLRGFLRNITDSSDTILGQAGYAVATSPASQNVSKVCGRFTIASQKVFEIKLYCQTARVTNGFGVNTGDSRTNVYTDVQIWRTGE